MRSIHYCVNDKIVHIGIKKPLGTYAFQMKFGNNLALGLDVALIKIQFSPREPKEK